jgi:hypothetical protein
VGIVLTVATVLGGIAALWFFWDKVCALFSWNDDSAASPENHLAVNPSRDNILRVIRKSDPRADWHRNDDEARSVTSYRHDANLRFEINYTGGGIQTANFQEPWANRHPDPHATGYCCRLYYGASLIGQYTLVSVDGGRAMLPLPSLGADREHPGPVNALEYRIAEIHDSLGTLREYMTRSGLVVETTTV